MLAAGYTVGEHETFLSSRKILSILLLCGIGYNVIKWSHCELKRDLLYFLNICNNIISQYINANPMEQCF